MSKTRSLLSRVGDFQQVISAVWHNMSNLTGNVPKTQKKLLQTRNRAFKT